MDSKGWLLIMKGLSKFFTETIADKNMWCGWYNCHPMLDDSGRQELIKFVHQNPTIQHLVIANNIETTRPQRTFGDLPEWFRPDSQLNSFDTMSHDNSFIFMTWNSGSRSSEYTEDAFYELIKSLPVKSEVFVMKGDGELDD